MYAVLQRYTDVKVACDVTAHNAHRLSLSHNRLSTDTTDRQT